MTGDTIQKSRPDHALIIEITDKELKSTLTQKQRAAIVDHFRLHAETGTEMHALRISTGMSRENTVAVISMLLGAGAIEAFIIIAKRDNHNCDVDEKCATTYATQKFRIIAPFRFACS